MNTFIQKVLASTALSRLRVLFFAGFTLVAFYFSLPYILDRFESIELQHLEDLQRQNHQNRAHSGIKIVELDDQSLSSKELKATFGRYPFRREVHAYLIRFLERAQAKILVMDMAFTGGEDLNHPESDQMLREAFNGSLPIITNLVTEATTGKLDTQDKAEEMALLKQKLDTEWLSFEGQNQYNAMGFAWPIVLWSSVADADPPTRIFLDTAMRVYPFANLLPDRNGKIHRAVLLTQVKDTGFLPTLPMSPLFQDSNILAFSQEGLMRIGEKTVNLRGEGFPIIHWYGNAILMDKFPSDTPNLKENYEVYPRFSFYQLVKSQLWHECQQASKLPICAQLDFTHFTPTAPEVFKDQYVFLGMNSLAFDMDNHSTLFDKQGRRKYPGVIIQANIFDNLLHDDFIGRSGWRVPLPKALVEALSLPFRDFSIITLLTLIAFIALTLRVTQWSSITLSLTAIALMGLAYNHLCTILFHQQNLWLNWIYPMTALLLTFSVAFIYRYIQSEKKKQQLRIAFSKYFPPDIMREIEKNPEKMNMGGRLEMTFLFCDIRGFTSFSEHNDPLYVREILNDYYTTMHRIGMDAKGTAFKFLGDGILAFWGFPSKTEFDSLRAVYAAMEMKKAIEEWDQKPDAPHLKIGIGINTGTAFFGNVGTDEYMDFTVIGDNVNLAARLQDLNKQLGTLILISDATYQQVKDYVEVYDQGMVEIRGKAEPVHVYEVRGITHTPSGF